MSRDDMPTSTTCPSCNETTSISPVDQTCDSCGADIKELNQQRAAAVRDTLHEVRGVAEDFPHGTLKAARKQSDVIRLHVQFDGPVRLQNAPFLSDDELNATVDREQHVDELARTLEEDVDAVSQIEIWTAFDTARRGSMFGMEPQTDTLPETDVIYLVGVSS